MYPADRSCGVCGNRVFNKQPSVRHLDVVPGVRSWRAGLGSGLCTGHSRNIGVKCTVIEFVNELFSYVTVIVILPYRMVLLTMSRYELKQILDYPTFPLLC